MKFDIKQQGKAWAVGAASAWASTRFGLTAEQAAPLGVIVGGAFDFLYFFVVKFGGKNNGN